MLLPDVNVWLALAFDDHLHHPSALTWFNGLAEEVAFFCRFTRQGFLRPSNNPQVFPRDTVSSDTAWRLYDAARSDTRVAFADEPLELEVAWREQSRSREFTPKLWNDAYLAAFAQTAG